MANMMMPFVSRYSDVHRMSHALMVEILKEKSCLSIIRNYNSTISHERDHIMIDVLFTHSYFLKFDPKEHKAMMPYAPLGTLYAASYIRTKGYSTALFDAMLAESERS